MALTLERDDELDQIAAAIDAAAGGTGSLLVIEGPAGIGKTRLVEDARSLARTRGFARLHATGDEPERSVPWGLVRQLIERDLSGRDAAARELILAGPAGEALRVLDRAQAAAGARVATQVLDALSVAAADQATAGQGADRGTADQDADTTLAATLHGLWWALADLSSQRPLLLAVDDAQWADVPSVRFLVHLARRIEDLSIVLVVGTRPPGPDADDTLRSLIDLSAERRIVPRPLSAGAIAEIAEEATDVTPAKEVADALHEASGGNPFLAEQLLREVEARGQSLEDRELAGQIIGLAPRTVSRALLARRSEDAVAMARGAAVLGIGGELGLARTLSGLEDDTRALAAVDELVAADLVTVTDGRLNFVHSVVREAVLAELGPGERRALHAAAARELAARHAPASRIAAHLVAAPAGILDDAGDLLAGAARALLADGDPGTAATYLARAIEERPGDMALRAELGEALLRSGDAAGARRHLVAAARRARTPAEKARRLSAAASALLVLEGPPAAVSELRAVLDESGAGATHPLPVPGRALPGTEVLPALGTLDREARLHLEARLGTFRSYTHHEFARSGKRLERFATLPGESRDERLLLALLAQRVWSDGRDAARVRELAARAVGDGATDLPVTEEEWVPWGSAVHALVFADGTDEARIVIERLRMTSARRSTPAWFVFASVLSSVLAWREGDITAAEREAAAARDAIQLAQPTPVMDALKTIGARFHVLALLARGDVEAARGALAEWPSGDPDIAATIPGNRLRHARAVLALHTGEPALARAEALALGAGEAAAGIDNPSVPWRAVAALAAERLNDTDAARELAREHYERALAWGTASDIGAALRLAARFAASAEQRLASLQEAVRVLSTSPWRYEYAAALADLGAALRVARRRSEARAPLRDAAQIAEACGARALQQFARESLEALGDKPRALQFSGLDSLTASERRIADLAAEGRTNREIAAELFITPKTVENHLGRVYLKLGVKGRKDLVGALV